MEKEKGWVSTSYMKKKQRMNVSFNVKTTDGLPITYVTVICPKKEAGKFPDIASAKVKVNDGTTLKLQVKVDGKKKTLEYSLQK